MVVWEELDMLKFFPPVIIAKQAILACFIFSKYGNLVLYLSTWNNSPDFALASGLGLVFSLWLFDFI